MENIYSKLRNFSKSTKAQNLFVAAKELSSIQLFKNRFDFSKLQEIYLSYLYMYAAINRDILIDKISEKVMDCELYEDSYMLWKRKNMNKTDKKDSNKKDLKLIPGKTVKFPKRT
jgi:hypothetical protein